MLGEKLTRQRRVHSVQRSCGEGEGAQEASVERAEKGGGSTAHGHIHDMMLVRMPSTASRVAPQDWSK